MSTDPGADERRARRAELRRRQVRRRRATGAALLMAVAGIGIWTAATLASGGSAERTADSLTTVTLTATDATTSPPATTPATTAATVPATTPALAARSVTIAWVGDTVVASKYGMPPDAGRRSMAPVVGPLRGVGPGDGTAERVTAPTRPPSP